LSPLRYAEPHAAGSKWEQRAQGGPEVPAEKGVRTAKRRDATLSPLRYAEPHAAGSKWEQRAQGAGVAEEPVTVGIARRLEGAGL
jgi:hypothetical protein